MSQENAPIDINGDGVIDEKELQNYYNKTRTHKQIAITCLVAICFITGILLTPIISIERVNAVSDLISMFYIMMGTVIGAYMGVSTWMTKK